MTTAEKYGQYICFLYGIKDTLRMNVKQHKMHFNKQARRFNVMSVYFFKNCVIKN